MNIIMPLIFAFLAAVGNAVFALGQKRTVGIENSISYVVISVFFAVVFTAMVTPFFGKYNYLLTLKHNWIWALVSGFGLFLLYVSFNLLFTRYGTANYVLYAILSIFTTSVIVGVFILKETLSFQQYIALALSVISIILFSI